MTRKTYRSAQGTVVDIGSIILQQENTRAVGNMGVNARGDTINSQNNVVESKNKQIKRQYERQTNVRDDVVHTSRAAAQRAQADEVVEEIAEAVVEESLTITEVEIAADAPAESGGLAAAIAKARQIKQEPLKTARQTKQETPGVRKI